MTTAEYEAFYAEQFKRRDANKDGALTLEEM